MLLLNKKRKIMISEIKWYDTNNPKLNIAQKNGILYFTSPLFDKIPWIKAGFSTRIGGVSENFCGAMNFAYNQYDSIDNVNKNYRLFSEAVGLDINKIVTPRQIHSTNIIKVEDNYNFKDPEYPRCDIAGADGSITNLPGVSLFSFSADCGLISIIDPINKAIGQCHSGWRGTAGKISKKAIEMMQQSYNSNPDDLLVTIWPSICPECFEVEWDMISEARKAFSSSLYDKIYYQKNEKKYQFNLWEANRLVLLEAGVKEENIFMPNLCTKCNPNLLFSHRNMGLKRGTLISFLSICE